MSSDEGIHSRRTVFTLHLRAGDDPRHPQGKLQRLRADATRAWKATWCRVRLSRKPYNWTERTMATEEATSSG
ncbi:MAG: hypothetical protein ACLTZY_01190 [Alistipes indistinctus]